MNLHNTVHALVGKMLSRKTRLRAKKKRKVVSRNPVEKRILDFDRAQ